MKYLMTEWVNGERSEDTMVTEEFVGRFSNRETREFFKGLGGIENYRQNEMGVIFIESVSPDRETVREVQFLPIWEA